MYWRKISLNEKKHEKKLNWVPQIISPFFVPEEKKEKKIKIFAKTTQKRFPPFGNFMMTN